MYPIELVYSQKAFRRWQSGPVTDDGLKDNRESSTDIRKAPFLRVKSWNDLREAVSFLTLMNKRQVLYFRGQGQAFGACVPVLFRRSWVLDGVTYPLNPGNRARYYQKLCDLRAKVLAVADSFRMPRRHVLQHIPAAAAAILQHYELWPTHFVDITRSLPIAVTFAANATTTSKAYVYAFAMPDLRGSITSDMDQQLTLARLEAVCPPAAKRPHHQDAYLASRFPEPPGVVGPGDPTWDDWQRKTDLMRRLVAQFELELDGARQLPGAPALPADFLLPGPTDDVFGQALAAHLMDDLVQWAKAFPETSGFKETTARTRPAGPAARLNLDSGGPVSDSLHDTTTSIEETVRALDDQERAAALTRDVDALERLWSDRFVVNAPNNRVLVGRLAVIDAFVHSGTIDFASFDRQIDHVEVDGDYAFVMGLESLVPNSDVPSAGLTAGQTVQRRFTNVWRREGSTFRLFARHASPMAR